MLRWRKLAVLLAGAIGTAAGQPALTMIQDTLYRADGTRFSGTMFIRYNSFQAGDTSNIATSDLTLQIVNGTLRVSLVPTTNASAGAQYTVTYNSQGINQFTELWAVPPTSNNLRVRDVRVSTGTIIGPPPILTPVQIGDVVGLTNELSVRPMKGVGFGIGRAAVINQAGQIDAATGNLGDCVRVDGSSGPCGSSGGGGSGGSFADSEIPAGAANGVNSVFTLAATPTPGASLELYRNGLLQLQGTDYTLSTNTVTFFLASIPLSGDLLVASYRFPSSIGQLTVASPQVICSSTGSGTSSTTPIELGSCTIPGGLLVAGDRLDVQFQFAHTGTAFGFTGTVKIGGTTVASRAVGDTETLLAGHTNFGIYGSGQTWDTQTWGIAASLAASAGTAAENTAQAIRVSLLGQMTGTSSDSVFLRNFTVIRYPVQVNP